MGIGADGVVCNHGFWDLPPEERAAIKDAACRRNDCADFYDLPPEERDRAYMEAERTE